jgi:hypothetical protein
MMVAGASLGLDSSEDEDIVVKRRSGRQKLMESDDEAAGDADIILKAHSHIGSDVEPDTELSEDSSCDPRVVKETPDGDVDTYKKKKKWKILLDSNCSLNEETPENKVCPKNSVEHDPQSHFSLMKESDLYDAEGSEDEAAPMHNVGHNLQSDFSLASKRDLYDAGGSEEAIFKHKSRGSSILKSRCVSERRSKVS